MKRIENQVIVVAGFISQTSRTIATLAVRRGAQLVLASQDSVGIESLSKELRSQGGTLIAIAADTTKVSDLKKIRDRTLTQFGRIDTWISISRAALHGKLMDGDIEKERETFEANFWAVRNSSRTAVPVLKETGGSFIQVENDADLRIHPHRGIHSAATHATKIFLDALRTELEEDKIPVNICLIRSHSPGHFGVAESVLACAVKPEPDVWAGSATKLFQVLDVLAPRMADFLIEKATEGMSDSVAASTESASKTPSKSAGSPGEAAPHGTHAEGNASKRTASKRTAPDASQRSSPTGDPAIGKKSSLVSKSESVLPLLSLGAKQLLEIGSKIAKEQVQPYVKDWRDSRR